MPEQALLNRIASLEKLVRELSNRIGQLEDRPRQPYPQMPPLTPVQPWVPWSDPGYQGTGNPPTTSDRIWITTDRASQAIGINEAMPINQRITNARD